MPTRHSLKRLLRLFLPAGLMLSALIACTVGCSHADSGGTTTSSQTATSAKQYTCPMHPDVVADKPGKCPKCGMELVEKK